MKIEKSIVMVIAVIGIWGLYLLRQDKNVIILTKDKGFIDAMGTMG